MFTYVSCFFIFSALGVVWTKCHVILLSHFVHVHALIHSVFVQSALQSRFLRNESTWHTLTLPNKPCAAICHIPASVFCSSSALTLPVRCRGCYRTTTSLHAEPALTQPKVSLQLAYLVLFAGSKQWVGHCVSDCPMWLSLLCCLVDDEVEPVQILRGRSSKFFNHWTCMPVCFLCVYMCVSM